MASINYTCHGEFTHFSGYTHIQCRSASCGIGLCGIGNPDVRLAHPRIDINVCSIYNNEKSCPYCMLALQGSLLFLLGMQFSGSILNICSQYIVICTKYEKNLRSERSIGDSSMFEDSGNSSGQSTSFRIIYYHKSHTLKDIDFKLFAVLGKVFPFIPWKRIWHLFHNRKKIL